MWDLSALRSPLNEAKKPPSQAVREIRGFLRRRASRRSSPKLGSERFWGLACSGLYAGHGSEFGKLPRAGAKPRDFILTTGSNVRITWPTAWPCAVASLLALVGPQSLSAQVFPATPWSSRKYETHASEPFVAIRIKTSMLSPGGAFCESGSMAARMAIATSACHLTRRPPRSNFSKRTLRNGVTLSVMCDLPQAASFLKRLLKQAADRLGACWHVGLSFSPFIDARQEDRLEANPNKRSGPGRPRFWRFHVIANLPLGLVSMLA